MASIAGNAGLEDIRAMTKSVPEMLQAAATLYEDRNALYGNNYKTFGKAMTALFPNGLKYSLLKEADWNRLGVLVQIVGKLTRYCANFNSGGHEDSLEDLAVYAMMLRELDSFPKVVSSDPNKKDVIGTGVFGGIDPE